MLDDTPPISATINGSLANSGLIVLNPTATSAGNTLTINGDYTGLAGSSVSLGSALNGSPIDRLVVTGNTSGASTVYVATESGAGAGTFDGIELISVDGISGATFTLGNRMVAGAYEYSLYKNLSGANTTDWYLTSFSNTATAVANPVPVPEPAPVAEPTPASVRMYRPETAAYAANLHAANTLFTLSLRDRSGETRYADPLTGEPRLTSLWMRNLGGRGQTAMSDGQNRTRTNRYVLQLGGDLAMGSTNGVNAFHAGLMGGYARANSSTHNGLTGHDAKGSVSGYSVGLYGTWYQNTQEKTGAWADSWVQYSWFSNEVKGDMLPAERYDSRGLQASLEAGYAWQVADWLSTGGMQNRVILEPHAQVVWSGIRADDHAEANGTRVQGTGNDNTITRLGLRAYVNGKSHLDRETVREFQPFVEANWLYSSQQYGVRLNDETDSRRGERNVAELKAGIEGRLSQSLTGSVVLTQQYGGSGYRDSQGSLQLSYRF